MTRGQNCSKPKNERVKLDWFVCFVVCLLFVCLCLLLCPIGLNRRVSTKYGGSG